MKKSIRQAMILDYLRNNKNALVSELAEITKASLVTIRHDLAELEANNAIVRSHGGAIYKNNPAPEIAAPIPTDVPRIPNLKLKEALAAAAVKLISEDDTIFIGGGTTFYVFSKMLKPFKNLKIVTTNVSVVYELSPYIDNIYFIGGELIELNGIYYTGGPKIPLELEKVFVNKAFIGVSGIDLNVGLTIYDLSQFNMLMSVRHIAQNVILLCDYTKFGCQSAHRIGPIQNVVDTIITNKEVDPKYAAAMEKLGINFIVV